MSEKLDEKQIETSTDVEIADTAASDADEQAHSVADSNETYDSGQIVFYKGSYYQARADDLKNNVTVNDDLGNFQGQFTVFPDDDFYTNERNERVPNDFWSPVQRSFVNANNSIDQLVDQKLFKLQ